MKLLIIEDNLLDRDLLLRQILKTEIFLRNDIRITSSIDEALNTLNSISTDLIMSDLGLPGESGVSGVERIVKKHPTVPLVVMTRDDTDETVTEVFRCGADDFLSKTEMFEGGLRRCLINAIERKKLKNSLNVALQRANLASEAKTRFFTKMSHEIRTPLNLMLGSADLLQETMLSEEQSRLVSNFQKSSEHLLTILSNVLDMSKIEAGSLTLQKSDFHLGGLLGEISELVEGACLVAGLEYRLKIEDGVPESVYGDPVRIRQVLYNLLNNSIKFTPSGSVSLTVQKLGPNIEFSVQDTGPGIPNRNKEHVFRFFHQLNNDELTSTKGTGVGLAIVNELVELMDGDVFCDRNYHSGARFVVLLPILPETKEQRDPHDRTEYGANEAAEFRTIEIGTGGRGPGLRILVAEDDLENRNLVQAYFSNSPHSLEFVDNGRLCVDAFKKQSFDLVLMDIQMPLMDGYEATQVIRQWESSASKRETPIYALSANAFREDIDMAMSLGFTGYLTKPIRKKKLIQLINLVSGQDQKMNTPLNNDWSSRVVR